MRLTNTRVRLGVGLLLAALFCIQCTQSPAFRGGTPVGAVSDLGGRPDARLQELEELARTDHIALIKKALVHYRNNFRDYRCRFIKQERINGRMRLRQEIDAKFMQEPFSVAMHWVKNAPLGDRILYVEGKYNGQMLVNPKGALILFTGGAVFRDPESKDVMANTLRPVTMFGFERLLESLLSVYELAEERGENTIRFLGYCTVGQRRAMKLERILPPRGDYPAKATVWYLDVEHLVPLGLDGTDWDDQPLCSYYYQNVEFNVGLTEAEFTPEANQMKLKQ